MRYILFVKDDCPFCSEATTLLEQKNLPYRLVNFDPDQEAVLTEIKKAHDWNTVPMIFYRNALNIKFIGGFTDLQQWLGIV
jgi:glutaredoxin